MTPAEIVTRRMELELTVSELAFALNIAPDELRRIEAGQSNAHLTPEFNEAFAALEERVFGLMVGA